MAGKRTCLQELGLKYDINTSNKTFGMNWKMTAKTILIQLHHKINTFENINKHLVLILQNHLLDYIKRGFSFNHISYQPLIGDSMHFHSYYLRKEQEKYKLVLDNRCSTDSNGIAQLLGLKSKSNLGFDEIAKIVENKLSHYTLFTVW